MRHLAVIFAALLVGNVAFGCASGDNAPARESDDDSGDPDDDGTAYPDDDDTGDDDTAADDDAVIDDDADDDADDDTSPYTLDCDLYAPCGEIYLQGCGNFDTRTIECTDPDSVFGGRKDHCLCQMAEDRGCEYLYEHAIECGTCC